MNEEQIRESVLRVLGDIASEADLSGLAPQRRLRDQLDLDSMDFLNFVIALHKELGVEIPERDYGQLLTLDACVNYLTSALHSSNG
jgi:acyl carrier protein